MTTTQAATTRADAVRLAYNRYQYARVKARREYETATAEANEALGSALDSAITNWSAELARIDLDFPSPVELRRGVR